MPLAKPGHCWVYVYRGIFHQGALFTGQVISFGQVSLCFQCVSRVFAMGIGTRVDIIAIYHRYSCPLVGYIVVQAA